MTKVNSKDGNGGFSLVEICIFLSLTAILTAMAIPMLGSAMHSMQLVSDARSISTSMSYAKLGAASQMTRYRLSFDLANNEWSLLRQNQSSGNYELQNAVNELSSGMANSGITFKSTSGTAPSGFSTTSSPIITIDSRGVPREGASIIYLSDADRDYAVSISLGGKVQIWRYQNSQWSTQ